MTPFRSRYRDALRSHLDEPSERSLEAAYELGRDAVSEELGVLDLAVAHNEALVIALERGGEPAAIAAAGGDFFLESLGAFEMVQRGFRDTRDLARLERRHAQMLRRLSHFLADPSLAGGGNDALWEVLTLVCEQARELVPSDCCVIVTRPPFPARATANAAGGAAWQAFVRWADLAPIDARLAVAGSPIRIPGAEVARLVELPSGRVPAELPVREWLAAPLTALDRRRLGSIHFIAANGIGFTAGDEAVTVHVAQITAAALERAALYSGGE